ncbi:lipoprotein [Streptomyces sp. KM77-8]|uniref:Lipoprotein n=1 Tax=Streptomyces haneummycinicus TaxID=3074435 RepID=A0AAT9HB51_9ACTN
MGMAAWKRIGVCLTAAAVVTGVAGCQDGDGDGSKKAGGSTESEVQTRNQMTEVLQAAFKNTSEAKSSKVRITMEMPAGPMGGQAVEMSGVQGWDPAVMDVTMKTAEGTPGAPDALEQSRMIMLDGVMYTDMGAELAAEMDGKRWMKMDFGAMAEAVGDPEAQKQMTGGLENMNQDPAKQLAMLLGSKSLKHVGPEKLDGVQTQHYKGTLSIEEMLDANKALDGMFTAEERKQLVANTKKSGLKGYDTEVWVNEDDYPAKMIVGMRMPEGTMKMTSHYSDYGAAVEVKAPAASETVDFIEMIQDLEDPGAGA